jgi:hypothetical protein
MTVEEASERFSAIEVVEWMAFFRLQKKEMHRVTAKGNSSPED